MLIQNKLAEQIFYNISVILPTNSILHNYFIFLSTALTKVYEKANSVVSYNVACPTWLHKYIIGRKGAGIQKLTAELQKVISL